MTIKGTLETFNLRELLQMLAFNQKAGTLVLATERGPRTIHVEGSLVTFVVGDPGASEALARVVRRREAVPPDRLERALKIVQSSGRFLGDVLGEMGLFDDENRLACWQEAAGERFLELQLSSITHFEFADGEVLTPDGRVSTPIEPALVVESLLLDLTRKMDQWTAYGESVPTQAEIYEGTGVSVDISSALDEHEIDPALADQVVPHLNGYLSLDHVADESHVDPLSVRQVVAVLLQAGGIRPVPTDDLVVRGEDLLQRGDTEHARALLQRAVEREDAPTQVRIRLADAFAAEGRAEDAAAELEHYVLLGDGERPVDLFDALRRAADLRGQDLAALGRVCDYYLENRPWLRDRHGEALEALRALVQRAVAARRPVEAAERMKLFIHHGDAPGEDLLVLADLYASGGARSEAAEALFRRAEDLLAAQRVAPARELLRRSLHLDPTRGDARSRLHVLEGQDRVRRRRRRVTTFLLLLSLLMVAAGAAWWTYNQRAGASVREFRVRAEQAVDLAEEQARALLQTFKARLKVAASGEEPDPGLPDAARQMLDDVRQTMSACDTAIYEYASELERYNATDHKEANVSMLRHLESRRRAVEQDAERVIDDARRQGREALALGEQSHRDGMFERARESLHVARNLAFDDQALRGRAELLLGHVERYRQAFHESMARLVAAKEAGDLQQAYDLAMNILANQLESDLTRTVMVPVRVTSVPPGAEVRLGGKPTGQKTPCVVEYSPFGATTLGLRLAGRVPQTEQLPSYARLQTSPAAVRAWKPDLVITLPSGPRWTVPASAGPFRAVWEAGETPMLLLEDGTAVQPVKVSNGELGTIKRFRRPQPVRAGGALPGGLEWRILGQRTLAVRPASGTPWEMQALGRLEQAPAFEGGMVTFVDELGTAYGLDAATGNERWRRPLGSPPLQPPVPSALGFLVTVSDGTAFALETSTGEPRRLTRPTERYTLVAPFGSGAIILGGGAEGLRVYGKDGTLAVRGAASPRDGTLPYLSALGVAWIEDDGVHYMGRDDETARHVRVLGSQVTAVAGADGVLYASAADGTVRAARPEAPDALVWETVVPGGRPDGLLVVGEDLLVLAGGGASAVAR